MNLPYDLHEYGELSPQNKEDNMQHFVNISFDFSNRCWWQVWMRCAYVSGLS